jgi:hypothetical protein
LWLCVDVCGCVCWGGGVEAWGVVVVVVRRCVWL